MFKLARARERRKDFFKLARTREGPEAAPLLVARDELGAIADVAGAGSEHWCGLCSNCRRCRSEATTGVDVAAIADAAGQKPPLV